jgi:hypothetical protein
LAYHCFGDLQFELALSELDLVKAQQFTPVKFDPLVSTFHKVSTFIISGRQLSSLSAKIKLASTRQKPKASSLAG